MRPFDVQIMGAIVLHEGDIAEMKTGEGKTLVATMPLYLNALPGDNVHLVTVNDYLAKRDAEWMGPSTRRSARGLILRNMMPFAEKQEAYAADITYGTNSEFGFDYLRDNMAVSLEATASSAGTTYAIVDEVDSILIDEARTPLIISGEPETAAKTYYDFARVVQDAQGRAGKVRAQGTEDAATGRRRRLRVRREVQDRLAA